MATIELVTDGPLIVRGVTQCRNSRGEAIAVEDPFYLCRCGASGKKPFCDGTHKKIGFQAAGGMQRPAAASPPAAPTPAVQVTKDGPYLVIGVPDLKCDVAPPDPARYSLCRCGASKTKPYCDGSHRAIDFKDDRN